MFSALTKAYAQCLKWSAAHPLLWWERPMLVTMHRFCKATIYCMRKALPSSAKTNLRRRSRRENPQATKCWTSPKTPSWTEKCKNCSIVARIQTLYCKTQAVWQGTSWTCRSSRWRRNSTLRWPTSSTSSSCATMPPTNVSGSLWWVRRLSSSLHQSPMSVWTGFQNRAALRLWTFRRATRRSLREKSTCASRLTAQIIASSNLTLSKECTIQRSRVQWTQHRTAKARIRSICCSVAASPATWSLSSSAKAHAIWAIHSSSGTVWTRPVRTRSRSGRV